MKATINRRQFFKDSAAACGGAVLLGSGLTILASQQASALPAQALRPPGALIEDLFQQACVHCGLCVRDCPYDTLKLASLGEGIGWGTPYFTARQVPCEMCEDLPCVKACPTGALDHALKDVNQAKMGIAVLQDQENCLNFLGLRCDVCYRVCPVIDQAITLENVHNPRSDRHAMLLPTVHSQFCTGCGKCEKSCVLPEAAIRVLPLSIGKAQSAQHYRRGWDEKAKAGGSLLGDLPAVEVNLPPEAEPAR
ncbi:ferredoxin-type protein NapG [Chitinibacter fontanus]|uniref:Ferredoxin-type protein NapG n=1 Tax=Chitinibacter fontanus TaxID=1737446 RepID=A0A7D5Z4S5_9NEIS|nr:ferredoxin-type protein NapG [Chitinibacter fontanus]QLI82161.1 ferredoxin-type protein NapG [Chitinibacter fontanus]